MSLWKWKKVQEMLFAQNHAMMGRAVRLWPDPGINPSGGDLIPQLVNVTQSEVIDNGLVEWFLSSSPIYQRDNDIRSFLYSGRNIENQVRAAVVSRNLPWVREKKNEIYSLGAWGRRSALFFAKPTRRREKTLVTNDYW